MVVLTATGPAQSSPASLAIDRDRLSPFLTGTWRRIGDLGTSQRITNAKLAASTLLTILGREADATAARKGEITAVEHSVITAMVRTNQVPESAVGLPFRSLVLTAFEFDPKGETGKTLSDPDYFIGTFLPLAERASTLVPRPQPREDSKPPVPVSPEAKAELHAAVFDLEDISVEAALAKYDKGQLSRDDLIRHCCKYIGIPTNTSPSLNQKIHLGAFWYFVANNPRSREKNSRYAEEIQSHEDIVELLNKVFESTVRSTNRTAPLKARTVYDVLREPGNLVKLLDGLKESV